jgi:hypothetical protein
MHAPAPQLDLRLGPSDGRWAPRWVGPLVAGVVVMSLLVSLLVLYVLATRQELQLLLEAALPKEVIEQVRGRGAAGLHAPDLI